MELHEKTLYKRSVNRDHCSNLRAGFVPVNEDRLHRTGLRGRKVYCVYIIVALLLLAVVVNLLITFVLLGVLRLGKDGMRSLEFNSNNEVVTFTQEFAAHSVQLHSGTVRSFVNSPVDVSAGNGQKVVLMLRQLNGSQASVYGDHIKLTSMQGFTVVNPATGREMFSTNFSDDFTLPSKIRGMNASKISTNRVTSGVNERLHIEAHKHAQLSGSTGVLVDGAHVKFIARQNVSLVTTRRLVLDASSVHLIQTLSLAHSSPDSNVTAEAYKVCVCGGSGKVFLMPAPHPCHHRYSDDRNPCGV